MTKFKKYGLWAVIAISTIAFIAAGTAKLMGVEMVHKSFAVLGLPVFTGYLVGGCEIAGAIGLFIKKLSALAAAGLALIMIGAMYYHLKFDPQGFMPAALLFTFSVIIFLGRKNDSLLFNK
ncbi:DoxX family protein [Marinomonas algicola]|uniref:DoxX family protein n=1 Tax=Marinomonas algicola TaxID=2773454 RepID=UPI00174802E5|nr:DoxX family protein [Marinomonas algicola]